MLRLTVYLPLLIVALFSTGLVWDWRKSSGFRLNQSAGIWLWRIQAFIAIAVMLAIAGYSVWFDMQQLH